MITYQVAKEFFDGLKVQWDQAVQDIQQSEEVKVYEAGCYDAGNHDSLYIMGNKNHHVYFHVNYEGVNIFKTKNEIIEAWFNFEAGGWLDEPVTEVRDLFGVKQVTMEEFLLSTEYAVVEYVERNDEE